MSIEHDSLEALGLNYDRFANFRDPGKVQNAAVLIRKQVNEMQGAADVIGRALLKMQRHLAYPDFEYFLDKIGMGKSEADRYMGDVYDDLGDDLQAFLHDKLDTEDMQETLELVEYLENAACARQRFNKAP